MNKFIRAFTDTYEGSPMSNTKNTYLELLHNTPSLLIEINKSTNAEKLLGSVSYNTIRNNLFIQQLKIVRDKNSGVWYIQLKGNRLDLQVKNNVIEGFKALYNNPSTKELATHLIEHSFVTTGFFKGANMYNDLIDPSILKEMGYNDHRKNIISHLKDNSVYLSYEEKERLIDQMIRNNPKSFTKTFDASMFNEFDTKAGLPLTITTSEQLAAEANRSNDLIWKDEFGETVTPQYIRVYDPINKQSFIYKQGEHPLIYHYTTPLGKNSFMLEINNDEDLEKSYLKYNNTLFNKKKGITKAEPTETDDIAETSVPEDISDEPFNIDDIILGAIPKPTETKVNKYDLGNNINDVTEPKITTNNDLKALNLGSLEGKDESPEILSHIDDMVINHPSKAIEGGESFNSLSNRVISRINLILTVEDANTVVVTHNTVFNLIKLWNKNNRPDKLTKEMREQYTEHDSEPTDHFILQGTNGPIYIVRHGETKDNVDKKFRRADVELTEKGIKQAEEIGEELSSIKIPKIISSTLTRAIKTSEIILSKQNKNELPDSIKPC